MEPLDCIGKMQPMMRLTQATYTFESSGFRALGLAVFTIQMHNFLNTNINMMSFNTAQWIEHPTPQYYLLSLICHQHHLERQNNPANNITINT